MDKQQLTELLEDVDYTEIRQRAMKIQLKKLGAHLESIKKKLIHIAEEDKAWERQRSSTRKK